MQQSAIIEDRANRLFFSYASLWEIAIKTSIGKLTIHKPIEQLVPIEVTLLSINLPHIQQVQLLPFHHRDPFDRLLIAQAITNNLSVMTDDGNFKKYNVPLME